MQVAQIYNSLARIYNPFVVAIPKLVNRIGRAVGSLAVGFFIIGPIGQMYPGG